MSNWKTGTTAASLVVAMLAASSAWAQDADEQSSAGGSQLEDIVVTAQRRSESLQDVPIAVSALSAAQIERNAIQSSQDIAVSTPGLTMTTNRNGVVPYLRGVGTQASTIDGSIAVYVDNVYFASTSGAIFGLNNVERVEVLKGPQGTLFGRNATGGLIHVITRDPSDTPELKVSLGYGNYDTVSGSLYATAGLAEGVSVNIAAYANHQGEGWGRNLFLNEDVYIRREWAVRSKLKFELGDATELVLSGDYAYYASDLGSTRQVLPGAFASGFGNPGVPHIGGFYDTNANLPRDGSGLFTDGLGSRQYGFSGILTHDLSDSIAITSTTAYRNFLTRSYFDNDLTPTPFVNVYFSEPASSFQQEVLLNGDSGPFKWTAGAIYYKGRVAYDPFIVRSSIVPTLNLRRVSRVTSSSYAFFGQGSYELADGTTLTLGGRYTFDRARIAAFAIAMPGFPGLAVGAPIPNQATETQPRSRTHKKWSRPTWRIALDHKITPDILAYASYSRGYKAGAFNPGTPPTASGAALLIGDAVDPEKLDAYEVGFKTDLLDRQFRLNGSAFYYDYTDIQLLQVVTATQTTLFNAGGAEIKGAELEAVFAPKVSTGRLEFRVSGTYLDAKYTDAKNVPMTTPAPASVGGNISGTLANAAGNYVVKTPNFSSTVGVDYTIPVSDDHELGITLNWQHNSRIYWEIDNRLSQDPTEIVNAQISFGRSDDAWRVRLWSRNLLGEKYYMVVNAVGEGDGGSAAAPRTFGITLDFKFGG